MNGYTRKNSLRMPGYNYSRPGYYFITICAKNGEVFFGEIRDDRMIMSAYGDIASSELRKTAAMTGIGLDCCVIMPNHIHFIAAIAGGMALNSGGKNTAPTAECVPKDKSLGHARQRIPSMVQNYKAAVSRIIGFSPWHRSYYDKIIKTPEGLEYIRSYINNNPMNWENDHLHPHNFEEYIRKYPFK